MHTTTVRTFQTRNRSPALFLRSYFASEKQLLIQLLIAGLITAVVSQDFIRYKQCLVSTRSRDLYVLNKQENTRREVSTAALTWHDSVAALAVIVINTHSNTGESWGLRAGCLDVSYALRRAVVEVERTGGCWLAGSRAWWRGRSGDRTLTARNDCSLLTWVLQMSLLEKKRWV